MHYDKGSHFASFDKRFVTKLHGFKCTLKAIISIRYKVSENRLQILYFIS